MFELEDGGWYRNELVSSHNEGVVANLVQARDIDVDLIYYPRPDYSISESTATIRARGASWEFSIDIQFRHSQQSR